MRDQRTKVKDKKGRIGAVEKVIAGSFCTVQFAGERYYQLCRLDNLEPATEEEFKKSWRYL